MSMHDEPRDPLDALIDDTARSMTDGRPPVTLRAAVRERLEPPGRAGWSVPVWQAGVAAGSLAVVVLLIVGRTLLPLDVAQDDVPPPSGLGVARESRPTEEGRLAAASVAAPREDAPQEAGTPLPTRAPIAAPGDPAVAPLPPGALLVVDALVLEPLEPQGAVELELVEEPMPLQAEWVQLEPITLE
jgi:hypothetical protein